LLRSAPSTSRGSPQHEPIDCGNELFAIRERAVEHELLRTSREQLLAGDARPASDVPVAEKGEEADGF